MTSQSHQLMHSHAGIPIHHNVYNNHGGLDDSQDSALHQAYDPQSILSPGSVPFYNYPANSLSSVYMDSHPSANAASDQGIHSSSLTIPVSYGGQVNPHAHALATSEEFASLLEEHCVPLQVNVPAHLHVESLQEFCHHYREHCQRVLGFVICKEFFAVEHELKKFWHMVDPQLLPNMNCDEGCRLVALTDDLLYQVFVFIYSSFVNNYV
jgi:hypothetical protein